MEQIAVSILRVQEGCESDKNLVLGAVRTSLTLLCCLIVCHALPAPVYRSAKPNTVIDLSTEGTAVPGMIVQSYYLGANDKDVEYSGILHIGRG